PSGVFPQMWPCGNATHSPYAQLGAGTHLLQARRRTTWWSHLGQEHGREGQLILHRAAVGPIDHRAADCVESTRRGIHAAVTKLERRIAGRTLQEAISRDRKSTRLNSSHLGSSYA